eukprot:99640-Rhodomonas_salina.1
MSAPKFANCVATPVPRFRTTCSHGQARDVNGNAVRRLGFRDVERCAGIGIRQETRGTCAVDGTCIAMKCLSSVDARL